jgi:hypothetical protein
MQAAKPIHCHLHTCAVPDIDRHADRSKPWAESSFRSRFRIQSHVHAYVGLRLTSTQMRRKKGSTTCACMPCKSKSKKHHVHVETHPSFKSKNPQHKTAIYPRRSLPTHAKHFLSHEMNCSAVQSLSHTHCARPQRPESRTCTGAGAGIRPTR